MARSDRPLSPHLQVYRPQITTVLSISHRFTGVALSAGLVILVYWLLAAAGGPSAYAEAAAVLGSGWMRLVLVAVSYAFFFHLANGIRHLAWDAGWGFEISQTYATGWAVIVASVVLTAGFWLALLV